jgi:hypothetical protein
MTCLRLAFKNALSSSIVQQIIIGAAMTKEKILAT